MKGVEFDLCDSKGKVLETLVTDSAGMQNQRIIRLRFLRTGSIKRQSHIS